MKVTQDTASHELLVTDVDVICLIVLTLLLNNPDRQNVMTVWKPLYEEAGLAQYAYSPPKAFTAQTDWPTLGEMIISGRRLVIFMDYGDDGWQVPWILPEFTNVGRFLSLPRLTQDKG